MPVRAVDDKASDTLVVVSGEGFWTGSSTLPHLHQQTPRGCARVSEDDGSGAVAKSPSPTIIEIGPADVTGRVGSTHWHRFRPVLRFTSAVARESLLGAPPR